MGIAIHIWAGLVGGLLAFGHCIGMCGGFSLHLSLEHDRARMLAGHLLWQAGRLCSYLFLGACAGYAGLLLHRVLPPGGPLQNLLSYLTGGIMLLMGLRLLGLVPTGPGPPPGADGLILGLYRRVPVSAAPGAPLVLGIVTGLLPCPIVVAFLAVAINSGSVAGGMAFMGGLGLGTAIPLAALGVLGRMAGLHRRRARLTVAGVLLVLLGSITILRGGDLLHRLLGCQTPPPAARTASPCCTGHGSTPDGR